jgi:polyhydroxyalkanoate synthesis regulator phasin
MPDQQQLTNEQQKAIQEILQRFRLETDDIINRHRQRIKKILEDLDAQKAQEIQKLLSKNP